MNLGIICDIISNKPTGVIGVDKETGTIGYITENKDLENVIEIILDSGKLDLPIREEINNNEILRHEKQTPKDSYYLIAFNYHLPYPWKILGIRYVEGDIEQVIQESYNYLEGI